jgi:hypothetical protein
MSLSRAHQVVAAELKNYFPRAHSPHDTCVYTCNCVAGDFEREQLVLRVTVVLAEFLKIIGYLTINVGQTHLRSYTLLAAWAAAVAIIAARRTVAPSIGAVGSLSQGPKTAERTAVLSFYAANAKRIARRRRRPALIWGSQLAMQD